ncbi:hypothetical protein Pyn_13198 [Prunus yedoensis var. nudiflora]|uniref:Uncharacterized protein n=1 Tax=Prunus yedoensis var. nudiflora TaxID=2094558 RepID=A0A314UJK4_PRUYE|nr:hypothetical protein Pyn_13198 [Prunus yedoensis var. nudiflora]
MGSIFSRQTELVNQTNEILELKECPAGDSDGEHTVPIPLLPQKRMRISSTKFHRNSLVSGRRRDIRLFRKGPNNGKMICVEIFAAHDFIFFGKFTFRKAKGQIFVDRGGDGAQGSHDDLPRLRFFIPLSRL